MGSKLIFKYFPALTNAQKQQFETLDSLYRSWNEKINVISRKDIDHLYEHHILHSLAIAKFIPFSSGIRVLDIGTGGGFPGIPLAILFPETQFHLVDSIRKKIQVVNDITTALQLTNTTSQVDRIENISQKFDFVVSRAVTSFPSLVDWVSKNLYAGNKNKVSNGIIYLKGEDISEELHRFGAKLEVIALSKYFEEEYFKTKRLIYLKTNQLVISY